MDTIKSAHGFRQLRNGEVIRAGDIKPAGYGCFEPVHSAAIGKTVFPERYGGYQVFRARTRALKKSGQEKSSARTNCVSNVNTSENCRSDKPGLV